MHRALPAPRILVRCIAVAIAYFVTTGVAVGLTRFEGGVACVWIASAVLLAALSASPRRHWPLPLVACFAASVLASGLWGLGWRAGPMLALINGAEAIIGAVLLRGWRVHRSGLDSLRNLALFVLAAGVIAPAVTALPGALLVTGFTDTVFERNVAQWFIAHALGALTFTPILALIASGELRRSFAAARRIEAVEAVLLLGFVASVAFAVFSQARLPILFLPVLPLMIATFRLGRIGAAFAIVAIAVIGGWLTLRGMGPVGLLHGSRTTHIQFLQFYLAITVMTVLPVAADLTRRARLFERLRDSEARFRLLMEHSTDIVMNLDVDGTIRYVSPSIVRLSGLDPDALLGRSSVELIREQDRARVRAVHLLALRAPGETFSVEFRGALADGEERWFETHTQAVTGDGVVTGVVSAIRETSQRKRTETELALAAHTDPLTGLANRRAFDRTLAALLAGEGAAGGGCVALFDLDHFKRVNDTHGHGVGDTVLRAFATAAAAHVRSGDMLARIGGEEFGLIFSSIPIAAAAAVCERIRVAVAALDLQADGWPVDVTVSIGIAPVAAGDAPADVLRNADGALYDAKARGRNRFSLAA